MAKDTLFRNSISGYNKDDVNRYIEELNIQYNDRGDELESEIRQLKKELEVIPELQKEKQRADALASEIDVLKKENSDLSDAIGAQGDKLEETNKELVDALTKKDSLEKDILRLEEKNSVLESENDKLRHDVSVLKSGFDSEKSRLEEKNSELRRKLEEVQQMKQNLQNDKDEFDRRVDEILMQIQTEAKAIISKANETAGNIIKDARRKAAEAGIRTSSYSSPSHTQHPRRDEYSEKIDSHKSKMDSFFAAISKTLRGE